MRYVKFPVKNPHEVGVLSIDIRGINNNKLISNPIQAPNQEFDEIVINKSLIKVDKNNIFVEVWVFLSHSTFYWNDDYFQLIIKILESYISFLVPVII